MLYILYYDMYIFNCRFPKDENKRKLWLKNIGLEDINLKKSASICSLHFKEKDINRTLEIICIRENAVPYVKSVCAALI